MNTQQITTDFQQRAAAAGLSQMLAKKHFDICGLDAVAKAIGKQSRLAGRDYEALRALHCMDWAEMGPDLARMVREKCFEFLDLPPNIIDIKEEKTVAPKATANKLLSFWRG